MIELNHVSVGYGGRAVLSDLCLRFPRGEVTALLGPNGCGKSTVLKTLLGMAELQEGSITVAGNALQTYDSAALARRVAYLPQNRRVPDMTVEQLVLHGRFPYLRYPRKYSREDREMARTAMEQVGIGDLAGTELAKLSGGTRQKAYIAMALAQDTDAVLLDEPTAWLDIAHQLQLMGLCRALAARGKAVVLVLHDLNLAMEYAHRVAVLAEGKSLICGEPEAVFHSGALEQAFGVDIQRIRVPEGWIYHCRERKEK